MIKEELKQVYAYVKSTYSSFTIPATDFERTCLNTVWLKHLSPYSLDVIYSAIDEHAKTNSFCNIAQIALLCEKVQEIKEGTYKTCTDYLNEIERSVSYSNCRENFAKLSDFAKQFVAGHWTLAQWAQDPSFNSVIMARLKKEIDQKLESNRLEQSLKRNKLMLETPQTKKELLSNGQ